jgi:hypothetical protein
MRNGRGRELLFSSIDRRGTGENIDSRLFLSAMEEIIEERTNQRSVTIYFGKNSPIYQRK